MTLWIFTCEKKRTATLHDHQNLTEQVRTCGKMIFRLSCEQQSGLMWTHQMFSLVRDYRISTYIHNNFLQKLSGTLSHAAMERCLVILFAKTLNDDTIQLV